MKTTKKRADKTDFEWEKKRVQRVLRYHNIKYGTNIKIIDRATNIFPQLIGQTNWDWVCRNKTTSEEVAVEVKRFTDEDIENLFNNLRRILSGVKRKLASNLQGSFYLDISLPVYQGALRDYPFLLQSEKKRKFGELLLKTVSNESQKLTLKKVIDLTPAIAKSYPLPDGFKCNLKKASNEGNQLLLSSGTIGVYSLHVTESQLLQLKCQVTYANQQLKVAKTYGINQTMLIFIEEGHSWIEQPEELEQSFKTFDPTTYQNIRFVYFISGTRVTEIRLPSTVRITP